MFTPNETRRTQLVQQLPVIHFAFSSRLLMLGGMHSLDGRGYSVELLGRAAWLIGWAYALLSLAPRLG